MSEGERLRERSAATATNASVHRCQFVLKRQAQANVGKTLPATLACAKAPRIKDQAPKKHQGLLRYGRSDLTHPPSKGAREGDRREHRQHTPGEGTTNGTAATNCREIRARSPQHKPTLQARRQGQDRTAPAERHATGKGTAEARRN